MKFSFRTVYKVSQQLPSLQDKYYVNHPSSWNTWPTYHPTLNSGVSTGVGLTVLDTYIMEFTVFVLFCFVLGTVYTNLIPRTLSLDRT